MPETLLLKNQGKKKTKKVELFNSHLFGDRARRRYRLRVNGGWFPKGEKQFYTLYQFRDILIRSIKNL